MNLKKFIFTVILLVTFSILLSSCKIIDLTKENVILKSELTNKENNLIKGTGSDKYFVFELNLEEGEYQWIELWVDLYEYGEYKGTHNNLGTLIDNDKDKHIMFSIQEFNDTERWVVSYFDNNTVSSRTSITNKKYSSSTWSDTNKVEIIEGEEHPLAVILGTNSNNISSVPIGFFINESDYIDDLLTNDYVYILKCRLYNERP